MINKKDNTRKKERRIPQFPMTGTFHETEHLNRKPVNNQTHRHISYNKLRGDDNQIEIEKNERYINTLGLHQW